MHKHVRIFCYDLIKKETPFIANGKAMRWSSGASKEASPASEVSGRLDEGSVVMWCPGPQTACRFRFWLFAVARWLPAVSSLVSGFPERTPGASVLADAMRG